MISLQNVTKIYPSRAGDSNIIALDNVSLEVEDKEFVSIAGRSGAGKTTLLKIILGEETPSSGKVFFDNQDISKIKKSQLFQLRRRIGIVFQDYKLFQTKTVAENISYAMEVVGARQKEINRDLAQILPLVGLTERACNFPRELSGGERQRVAIARALIHRPDIILADEPTGNLDPYHTHDIIELLLKINKMGTAVVLATHNKELINYLGKRVITLERGRMVRDEKRGRFVL